MHNCTWENIVIQLYRKIESDGLTLEKLNRIRIKRKDIADALFSSINQEISNNAYSSNKYALNQELEEILKTTPQNRTKVKLNQYQDKLKGFKSMELLLDKYQGKVQDFYNSSLRLKLKHKKLNSDNSLLTYSNSSIESKEPKVVKEKRSTDKEKEEDSSCNIY